jgi:hypothetical protein
MSEKETGVGIGGSRLGIFNRTSPIRASCPRIILEMGAHSSPKDFAIMQTSAYYEQGSRAIAEGVAAFLGWERILDEEFPVYRLWRKLWSA